MSWLHLGGRPNSHPRRSGFELLEGTNRIETGFTSNGKPGQHDGQTHHGDADQIDEDERAAAVLADNIRKLPDITQADSGAGSGHNETHSGFPESSFVVRFSHGLPV